MQSAVTRPFKSGIAFQVPGQKNGYFLDRCAEAASGARSGGGMFAWATSSGIDLFFNEDSIDQVVGRGGFDLLVGTDSITDVAAVQNLQARAKVGLHLSVAALVHEENALFHPKIVWFRTEDELRLITGSGNLTFGGLKKNWEAFHCQTFRDAEAATTLAAIEGFRTQLKPMLFALDEPIVLERVKQNAGSEFGMRKPAVSNSAKEEEARAQKTVRGDVLVAEIPRSSNRWRQVNFDKASFENFFDAGAGRTNRTIFVEVGADGTLGEMENRPAVQVASQNYRFELSAARGSYPENGRPIGIFARVGVDEYAYHILLPGTQGAAEALAFLDSTPLVKSRSGSMRRMVIDESVARRFLPSLGLWKDVVPAEGA